MTQAIITLIILSAIGLYTFYAYLKSFSISMKTLIFIYGVSLSAMITGFILMWQRQVENYANVSTLTNFLISISFAVFLALFFSTVIYFIADIIRFIKWGIRSIIKRKITRFVSRSKISGFIAFSFSALLLILIMYGTIWGFSHYKVHTVQFQHEKIPEAFDGFKIVQISDMHLGTFSSIKQVEKGLELIKKQQADIIVFTGDMVNNISTEASPYIEALKEITAPFGKYAILGNHDYAHYAGDLTEIEMQTDTENLRKIIKQMGFEMLKNEHEVIQQNNDSIILTGVENWGIAPFPKYGDLDKALNGVKNNKFVVLLSHDPSHWDEQALQYPVDIALTLSGHTHGMQFGFEVGGYKWSPVQYRYGKWAGLYQDNKKYLYVNRGFGGIGFPGRVGIRPEITVIELNSKN
ncbi:MAG: metallophosphoesterase [Prolixibacteraceae bacterium]|jgi:predicted MPP superfamily phosphohydrolase|nr:metallophosphoesterase [Prolixibacteraceae bacterium]